MALEGSVRCRCWESNQTTDPPVKVFLDPEGDDIFPIRDDKRPDSYGKVLVWLEECCAHPGMNFVYVHMPSFTALSEFAQALDEVAPDRFPALKDAIPGWNGGLVAPEIAARGLVELAEFEKQPPFGDRWSIVDSQTGSVVYKHLNLENPMLLGGVTLQPARFLRRQVDARFGLDDGRFVVVRETSRRKEEVFAASTFRQMIDDAGFVQFTDLEDGTTFRCESDPDQRVPPWKKRVTDNESGKTATMTPTDMHVERRQICPGDFPYTIKSYRELFHASVETGNPVRWH